MDMVIITMNYRLGPFGFLSIDNKEDGEITDSNWGFLDQQKAIRLKLRNFSWF